jgi:hypothetical protein
MALAVIAFNLISLPVKADMEYGFVKMTCDQDSHTAMVKVLFEYNKEGKARSKRHEKDIYPLGDRSGPTTMKSASCDLGDGQTVSFKAYQKDLPKDDYIMLFLNDKKYGSQDLFSPYHDPQEWVLHSTGNGIFEFKTCDYDSKKFDEDSNNDNKCALPLTINANDLK